MALLSLKRWNSDRPEDTDPGAHWIEPRLGPVPTPLPSEVFDRGAKTIVDCAHVKVERLDTEPVQFSKVFKEFEDRRGHKYDYRYWAERENYFLREFLKKQSRFTHVVQARHLISENEAAKQVLTCDAGITIANWLRVKARYTDTATLSHPFQRVDMFLRLVRACLVALKELHENRIVHCDIKEDNICIPYGREDGDPVSPGEPRVELGFEQLKLIDFAFSVAHAMPLSQILVIDPEERLPYQSDLLVSALRADRKSGSPDAVQQLDYRVDLFSLGYMAEKIAAAGLVCGRGCSEAIVGEVNTFVQVLKAFDTAPALSSLPHDTLLAAVDRLLETAGGAEAREFNVAGEWTAEEMAHGRIAGRQTPLTPVALPMPTPVARPLTPSPLPSARSARTWLGVGAGSAAVAALVFAFVYFVQQPHATVEAPLLPAPVATVPAQDPASAAITVLTSPAGVTERARAFGRLSALAKNGNAAATAATTAFEAQYDSVKQTVAKSQWWTKGQGAQPAGTERWMQDGKVLAENGDRPALLDVAYATGHGRGGSPDRATAADQYLKVIERSSGDDAVSKRLRLSASRGLAALLNVIVEQKDTAAASLVLPALEAKAQAGAADVQYYVGLIDECATEPADLDAARGWYRKAAADPAWKAIAERKSELLGKWCPRPAA